MEIRVNLPENIYRSVTELAVRTSRGVDEVIADKLRDDFSIENIDNEELVAAWSDEDVLALANLKLPLKQDRRLSQLLERQRESRLTMNEKVELEGLMGLQFGEFPQISRHRSCGQSGTSQNTRRFG